MRATRLPRLHVITDTRGPVAPATRPAASPPELAFGRDVATAVASSPGPIGIAGPGLVEPVRGAVDGTGLAAAPILEAGVAGPVAAQRDPLSVVEASLAAGARLIQVRPEDHYTDRAAFDLATAIAALCDQYGAVCLINDRVHLALAVGADGVHLGADDLPIDAARRILPAASIIGGTARDPESARAARRAGATYLGVGPVWGTTTKAGLPQPIGLEGLAAVCEAVDLPVIAIGGITAERAALCREAGAHGVAVVGAIAAAADPREATAALLAAVGEDSGRDASGIGADGRRVGRIGGTWADGRSTRGFSGASDNDDDRLRGSTERPDASLLRGVGEA